MKKYKWHRIAYSESELLFNSNNLLQVEVAEKKICIAKTDAGLSGCAAKCPHAAGNMSDGFIDAMGHIVCPLHRYKFSLVNGRDAEGEGYFLKIYPLRVDNDGVFVGIEETGFSFF